VCEVTRIIAIDGPAAAGKSSTARRVAQALGYAFLDTGAMYRAATWRAISKGIDLDDAEAVTASTEAMGLEMKEEDGLPRVFVDGRDVTEAIRSPEVTGLIYKVDQIPEVRDCMVRLQRQFGAHGPTTAEGRDIGTVVFPKARCKIFLDASLDERTRRRARDMEAKGIPVDVEKLRDEIHQRDEKNRNRDASPLRPAEDAVLLDTTTMTLDEVVEAIVQLARERL